MSLHDCLCLCCPSQAAHCSWAAQFGPRGESVCELSHRPEFSSIDTCRQAAPSVLKLNPQHCGPQTLLDHFPCLSISLSLSTSLQPLLLFECLSRGAKTPNWAQWVTKQLQLSFGGKSIHLRVCQLGENNALRGTTSRRDGKQVSIPHSVPQQATVSSGKLSFEGGCEGNNCPLGAKETLSSRLRLSDIQSSCSWPS